jgi:SAM-dependent methyltransferase
VFLQKPIRPSRCRFGTAADGHGGPDGKRPERAGQEIEKEAFMDKRTSNVSFSMMAFCFKIRDLFSPPMKIVAEVGIAPGNSVLDYGCGPGSHTIAAAEIAGETGKTYGVDIHPSALKAVRRAAAKKNLKNVETILTDCPTDLSDNSIDVVLLYDTYHDLEDPGAVMKELHRILKPDSTLSFSDHHMKDKEIVPRIEGTGLFKFASRARKSFLFRSI